MEEDNLVVNGKFEEEKKVKEQYLAERNDFEAKFNLEKESKE